MELLVLQFAKEEEKHQKKSVKNLPLILQQVFTSNQTSVIQQLSNFQELPYNTFLQMMRNAIVQSLHLYCGMDTYMFQSRDQDEVFCKIYCEDFILLQAAQRYLYKLQMNPELQETSQMKDLMPFIPYQRSKHEQHDKLYSPNLLTNIDRMKIAEKLIRDTIHIESLIKYNVLIDMFMLHQQIPKNSLQKALLVPFTTSIPIIQLKNYFGEKVTFYFIWLQFYISRLTTLAELGVLVWILGKFGDCAFYRFSQTAFGVFVMIWAAMFQIFWNRKSKYWSVRFGTENSVQKQITRQSFQGTLQLNPITRKHQLVFPTSKKIARGVISYCTSFFMVGLVIALTMSLFIYRAILLQSQSAAWGPMVCAIANTVQILVMNVIYDAIALKLNEWENHKTVSDFQNALIIKKVGYQFVNYYISLFYIAFIKANVEGCDNNNCMGELNFNLWVMFILNMVFNVIEMCLPIFSMKAKIAQEQRKIKKMIEHQQKVRQKISHIGYQSKLFPVTLLNEYLELVMNFGYIIFFSIAFPLGPAIYWFYNILELKADTYKFLKLSKRPSPESADSIGVWNDVMNFLAIFSVITNTGLIIFTKNVFGLEAGQQWQAFLGLEHILIFVMIMMLSYYPTVSHFLKDVKKRQSYLKKRFFSQSLTQEGKYGKLRSESKIDFTVNFSDSEKTPKARSYWSKPSFIDTKLRQMYQYRKQAPLIQQVSSPISNVGQYKSKEIQVYQNIPLKRSLLKSRDNLLVKPKSKKTRKKKNLPEIKSNTRPQTQTSFFFLDRFHASLPKSNKNLKCNYFSQKSKKKEVSSEKKLSINMLNPEKIPENRKEFSSSDYRLFLIHNSRTHFK